MLHRLDCLLDEEACEATRRAGGWRWKTLLLDGLLDGEAYDGSDDREDRPDHHVPGAAGQRTIHVVQGVRDWFRSDAVTWQEKNRYETAGEPSPWSVPRGVCFRGNRSDPGPARRMDSNP